MPGVHQVGAVCTEKRTSEKHGCGHREKEKKEGNSTGLIGSNVHGAHEENGLLGGQPGVACVCVLFWLARGQKSKDERASQRQDAPAKVMSSRLLTASLDMSLPTTKTAVPTPSMTKMERATVAVHRRNERGATKKQCEKDTPAILSLVEDLPS